MAHLKMFRGDDVTFTITPTVAPEDEDDLVFTAKESLADLDDDAVLSYTTFDNVAITEAGLVTVTVDATDTDDLEMATRLYWDLQSVVSGKITTLATGSLDILLDVTRTTTIES